eukprot:2357487-Amphidinium_carterae.1
MDAWVNNVERILQVKRAVIVRCHEGLLDTCDMLKRNNRSKCHPKGGVLEASSCNFEGLTAEKKVRQCTAAQPYSRGAQIVTQPDWRHWH